MSDETTLLSCPFCGSRYTQVRWIGFKDKSNGAFESGFRGECTECFALTRAFSTEAEAIAAWNTRAEKQIEQLKSFIEYVINEMYGCKYFHSCEFCSFDQCKFEKEYEALKNKEGNKDENHN